MSAIHAVLLVPEEGDPLGLVAEGPCGARPPLVFRGETCGHEYHRRWIEWGEWEYRECYMCRYPQLALVLAWGGEVVPEGCDRAQELLLGQATGAFEVPLREGPEQTSRWVHAHWFRACVKAHLEPGGYLAEYATRLAEDPRWTVVLLDADGHEVTP